MPTLSQLCELLEQTDSPSSTNGFITIYDLTAVGCNILSLCCGTPPNTSGETSVEGAWTATTLYNCDNPLATITDVLAVDWCQLGLDCIAGVVIAPPALPTGVADVCGALECANAPNGNNYFLTVTQFIEVVCAIVAPCFPCIDCIDWLVCDGDVVICNGECVECA